MDKVEIYRQLVAIYDLLREVFFNHWQKDTFSQVKLKSCKLEGELAEHRFITSINELSGNRLDEARWEYNRLFIGPQQPIAIPFESAYRTEHKTLMGKYTYDVRKFYERAGIVVENKGHFPDDFIGFEFQYIYYISLLIVNLYDKIDDSDGEMMSDAERLIVERTEFINKHPKMWFKQFADDIIKGSKVEVMKELGNFIMALMQFEERVMVTYKS